MIDKRIEREEALTDKQTNREITGFPSIDKPWRKYYSDEEINMNVPEGTMYDYIFERNKDYLHEIALEYYGRKMEYQELFMMIDRCCRCLSGLGVKKGDVVTIQTIALPQVIVLMYALNRIGACGNMLYPDAKAEKVISTMQRTNSKLLVVLDHILSSYELNLSDTFEHRIILLNIADEMTILPKLMVRKSSAYMQKNHALNTIPWKAFIKMAGTEFQENHDADVPAFMLRTGGTTGIQKEVVLSSRNFNGVAEGVYRSKMCPCWERQRISLLLLPPFIAFGIGSGIHHSLAFGTKLVISLDISPNVISKLFKRYKPNYVTAGTVQIEQFMNDLEQQKDKLDYIKMLAVGGESMNAVFEERLQKFLKKHQCDVIPIKGYGLTETTACVVAETIHAHRIGSVGIPIGLCNVKIVDIETGKECGYDSPGEICLSSPGIMQGYFANEDATNEVMDVIDGVRWLHTGDVGEIAENGMLTITGRIKRIIVCREGLTYHKVFPLLIEECLLQIDGIQEISIVGRPDETVGNVLVAFVVLNDGVVSEQVMSELKKFCNSSLEVYERPVEYIIKQELPRTLIGKVDYRALEKEVVA
jgi:long-chain acyl-CoA synthetase